ADPRAPKDYVRFALDTGIDIDVLSKSQSPFVQFTSQQSFQSCVKGSICLHHPTHCWRGGARCPCANRLHTPGIASSASGGIGSSVSSVGCGVLREMCSLSRPKPMSIAFGCVLAF